MNSPFDDVKDSSIWYKPSNLSLIKNADNRLYIGIVRSAFNDKESGELRYLVEVRYKNDIILTNCRMLRRFGGVYNFEDYISQGYNFNEDQNNTNGTHAKAGDIVLVGQFGGQGREGVILGGLSHPARRTFLNAEDGPQYKSEFNGIETFINKDGEYTLTFKGIPTNISGLSATPDKPIPAPEYDVKVGTSYIKIDKTGSFTINDNAQEDPQKLFIDKANGTVELIAGKVSLKFTKKSEKVELTAKSTKIVSTDDFSLTTKKTTVDSTDSMSMSTKKYNLDVKDLATIKATDVHVIAKIFLGADSLTTSGVHDGVVTGVGIDTLTGTPYALLGNASTTVFAKK